MAIAKTASRAKAAPVKPAKRSHLVPIDDKLRVGIDIESGFVIAVGSYEHIRTEFEKPEVEESATLWVGAPDDEETLWHLNPAALFALANLLGVENAGRFDRTDLIMACGLAIAHQQAFPGLSKDIEFSPENVLQYNSPSAILKPPTKESSPSTQQGASNMAAAKKAAAPAETATAAPAKGKGATKPKASEARTAPAPQATPRAAKPKAAEAKPAEPKPAKAAAKPATAKPATPVAATGRAKNPAGRPPSDAREQNGIKEPTNYDGKCGQVWAACDALLKAMKKGEEMFSSGDVIEKRPDLNPGNVRVEASRWAKFHGHTLARAPRPAKTA